MNEHPIEGLMITAMNSIKDMIDVNTIIGEPIESKNITIIPISKVSFGFAAGGSEFTGETVDKYTKAERQEQINYKLPFGGGAGAGVSISPIAFIVINNGNVKLVPVNHATALDKLLDYVPDLIEKTSSMVKKCLNKKENKNEENLDQDEFLDDDYYDDFEDEEDDDDFEKDITETIVYDDKANKKSDTTMDKNTIDNKKDNEVVKKVSVRKRIKKPDNKSVDINLEDE
ncbi:MAG: GerW family sporulation protein [Clostridia bacterium]|nr:GerW family sporulation protein [Clostridia bacterium]